MLALLEPQANPRIQFAELRGRRFDVVRSSAAGTRLLLVPDSAPTLPKDSESDLDLTCRDGESGQDLVVRRVVAPFPVSTLWEV
jgi:hypothetical protein